MKLNYLIFGSLLICISLNSIAQKTTVSSGTANLAGGINPASFVEIENADIDLVNKRWSSYLKDMDGKLKNTKGEYFLDNTKIPAISPDTLDMSSRVEKIGNSVRISLAANRNGEFLSSTSTGVDAMNNVLYKFAVSVKKEMKENEIEVAEKLLNTKMKSKKELEDKNEKLSDNNADMKSKIADNERNIEDNKKNIDSELREIETQKSILNQLKKALNDIE